LNKGRWAIVGQKTNPRLRLETLDGTSLEQNAPELG